LNTDFGEVLPDLGRGFSFAHGHKENGSMFSHMAVMYAYALYQRGMVKQGYKVLDGIYQHCQDFGRSHIYPGIPEYINARGRGMYTYLTGSASWYLLTLVTESFGVKGKLGDLVLEPKLVAEQFDKEGKARLKTSFAGRDLDIVYVNPNLSDFGHYLMGTINLDGQPINQARFMTKSIIPRQQILALDPGNPHQIIVDLT
jgi:cellobiose phosphorylase